MRAVKDPRGAGHRPRRCRGGGTRGAPRAALYRRAASWAARAAMLTMSETVAPRCTICAGLESPISTWTMTETPHRDTNT